MYTCAKCGVRACRKAEDRTLPKNCPIREEELSEQAFQEYRSEDHFKFYVTASAIEGLGQFQWPRVKETLELCRRMGYHRIGLAFCSGLSKEAKIMCELLERNGFEVVSVMCKVGGRDKCAAGVPEEYKLHPGQYEAMCNPIFQAKLLNQQKTEFNIALGLCVGHDSLLYKYSDALVTTLIAKDRVLAHNPAGALYCAEGYYKNKLDAQP
ncbi:MAG: DUF1847 domain-containing protein [Enterocloster asparagiformis]|nr:DUF1847 domain-containing protein [Enterocloster asparagiformis]